LGLSSQTNNKKGQSFLFKLGPADQFLLFQFINFYFYF